LPAPHRIAKQIGDVIRCRILDAVFALERRVRARMVDGDPN
jgi:hypothetical protein